VRALHAIHDFLPRHQAGSEIYCLALCQALGEHGVAAHVLCSDYDPALPHGELRWSAVDGIGVTTLVNNWAFDSFAQTYRSPLLDRRLAQVLDLLQPDVLHVHNLLNLSFSLPALAQRRGIPVVATLHDYTLVCPSGGQRVHVAEQHVCHQIDPARCARCFGEHPLAAQLAYGRRVARRRGGRRLGGLAAAVRRRLPLLFARLAARAGAAQSRALAPADITDRLAAAREVFADVDLFVAPSQALGEEYLRLGVPATKLRVSDYGFPPLPSAPRLPRQGPLRVGFVGTLVWHKGAHVALAALRLLPPGACTLTLCGDPEVFPQYASRLRHEAAGLPVRFAGRFERAAAAAVYAGFDVLVVPSLWPENSPLVIHEAFQAGVPVVGARIGGIPGLVRDGVGGLLTEPGSAADLAAALERLRTEPGLLERLADAVPAVKSLAADAAEWRSAYAALARDVRAPAGASPGHLPVPTSGGCG
jgi:glycosyltransferase involved in cell wall biosynthesis